VIRYHAGWVVPIAQPPIRDAWVAIQDGRIAAMGRRSEGYPDGEAVGVDLGEVAVLPGLVNAHTHLELSYLRDAVPPASEFVTWIRGVMAARQRQPNVEAPEVIAGIAAGISEAVACGTALVGDISNTLATCRLLASSPLGGVVFYELIRFNAPDAAAIVETAYRELDAARRSDRVRLTLAAHAPYSVSPHLFREIRRALKDHPILPCSVHLSESAAEVEFIETGGGAWRTLLEQVGAWDPAWVPPGVSPVQYLDESGFLDARVLAVHGVQMTDADLARLAARGTTLVTCPRSNGHTGAGAPPIRNFYASSVPVAIGTDSLASAPDLNVFAEVATLHALAPDVPPASLLDSATRQGARALGFEDDYGTIERGKIARLLAVDVAPGVADVEEYLVSGIAPGQIRWIEP
jgi:cytosine/adenosine deaminase-related metal-dependent hydrolase